MKTPNAKTRATDPCTSQWAAQTVRTRQQMYHLLNTLRILTKNEPCSGYTDEYIYAENIRRYNDTPQGLRSRVGGNGRPVRRNRNRARLQTVEAH